MIKSIGRVARITAAEAGELTTTAAAALLTSDGSGCVSGPRGLAPLSPPSSSSSPCCVTSDPGLGLGSFAVE